VSNLSGGMTKFKKLFNDGIYLFLNVNKAAILAALLCDVYIKELE
jgi:hypothetical protein